MRWILPLLMLVTLLGGCIDFGSQTKDAMWFCDEQGYKFDYVDSFRDEMCCKELGEMGKVINKTCFPVDFESVHNLRVGNGTSE